MTFIVNGIKEGFDKKYNIEFFLGVDSALLAKKFLENSGVIVLSLKEYKEKGNYGNISLIINYQEQSIPLGAKFEGDLIQACKFFLMVGFDITNINFVDNPVTDEEVQKIIETSKKENAQRIEEEKKMAEKKEEVERKIFEDPRLAGDKKVIERIFQRIEEVLTLTQGFVSGKDLKKIREKEDELKKLKLGTNHERIVELVEEMTSMLESMEIEYYNANRDKEKIIFEDSIVTDIDIQKQLNKVEKVQQLKNIGGKIKSEEQQYQLFDKYIIFLNVLIKDIVNIFKTQKSLTNMLYNTYDLVEIAIIFILIQIPIYMIANTIFLFSNNTNYEYFYLISIKTGLIGLLIYGARRLRKKNIVILIALIPAMIIVYYIFITLINNNFSL